MSNPWPPQALRPLSARATLTTDNRSRLLVDTRTDTVATTAPGKVGLPGPLPTLDSPSGPYTQVYPPLQARTVEALKTNKGYGPVQLTPVVVLTDNDTHLWGDPDGAVIGVPGVWVGRYVAAVATPKTRR